MKSYLPRPHALSLPAICLASILLLITSGCDSGSNSQSGSTSNTAATESTPPGIASAVPTSFDAVTSQLDAGGNLYAYIETRQWTEGLSGKVDGLRELVLSLPDIPENDHEEINQVFDVVVEAIRRSGLESIGGAGVSGIELEPDLFQSKIFVHRLNSDSNTGMWTLFGEAPRPLDELEWLPANTAWAAFSDADIQGLWNGLSQLLMDSGIPNLQEGPQQAQAMVQGMTGKPLDELLNSLGGSMGGFLTLNQDSMIAVPVGETPIEVPEPGLVLALKVNDDTLFDLAETFLAENEQVIRVNEDNLRMRVMPVPVPVPIEVRLTLARTGDYLFLATHDRLIRQLMAVQAGEQPGLTSADEFQRLADGIPMEGNSFGFTSDTLVQTIREVQMKVMASNPQFGGDAVTQSMMEKMASWNSGSEAFSVGKNGPDGWLTVMRGAQNPTKLVALPLVVAPAGLLAGIAIPNFVKARETAQSNACVNNLKQLALGAIMYADLHEGQLPSDFLQLQEHVGAASTLICPRSPMAGLQSTVGWSDLDAGSISYEYLGEGVSVDEDSQEPIWRCKHHEHEALADGSVTRMY